MWNVSDYVLMLGMLTELPRGARGGDNYYYYINNGDNIRCFCDKSGSFE